MTSNKFIGHFSMCIAKKRFLEQAQSLLLEMNEKWQQLEKQLDSTTASISDQLEKIHIKEEAINHRHKDQIFECAQKQTDVQSMRVPLLAFLFLISILSLQDQCRDTSEDLRSLEVKTEEAKNEMESVSKKIEEKNAK